MSMQLGDGERTHEPVLLAEVVDWLGASKGSVFIDCTVGLGGHAEAILRACDGSRLIGVDRDLEALKLARERLAGFGDRFQAVHANFDQLAAVMMSHNVSAADGVLADLGVSSLQLDTPERGFSFATDSPLDMRMDQTTGAAAAELVRDLTEGELADLIFEYGEERGARKIARAIVRERQRREISTTKQLADIVVRALRVPGRWRIHPATRTFQALRLAVNSELQSLSAFIPVAVAALARGGRLAIISFHSLEDRIVKRSFQLESGRCLCEGLIRTTAPKQAAAASREGGDVVCARCGARRRVAVLTRKPIRPSAEEIRRNPRSRSARLRVCERL
ncbi:MAG TPA: 16S rRNA (cytosine(1402)-N(4))-methyltransferase RsmH [Blastocatellia bacterium]|nr:16S rRNA (cytosine(1402)-N(4))-methyltransferase RsmH [Blastocatellia bacterium]